MGMPLVMVDEDPVSIDPPEIGQGQDLLGGAEADHLPVQEKHPLAGMNDLGGLPNVTGRYSSA